MRRDDKLILDVMPNNLTFVGRLIIHSGKVHHCFSNTQISYYFTLYLSCLNWSIVIASQYHPPRLFFILKPISTVDCLNSFSYHPVSFPDFQVFQVLTLLLVSLSPSCSLIFQLSSKVQVFVQFFAFLYIFSMVCWNHDKLASYFFFLL